MPKETLKKQPKSQPTERVRSRRRWLWLAIIAGLAILGYGLIYQQTAEPEENFVLCKDGRCLWSAHIHADLFVTRCEERIALTKEEGPVDAVHTHKESDRIHWHKTIPVHDAISKEPLDPSLLSVRQLVTDLDISLEPCSGQSTATMIGTINGQVQASILETRWKDGDRIELLIE